MIRNTGEIHPRDNNQRRVSNGKGNQCKKINKNKKLGFLKGKQVSEQTPELCFKGETNHIKVNIRHKKSGRDEV